MAEIGGNRITDFGPLDAALRSPPSWKRRATTNRIAAQVTW
jgi:hypothetical protein